MVSTGCLFESPAAKETRSRIEQKAETAKGLVRQRAQSGEDVSGIVATMEAAGDRFEKGDVVGGETLLDQALAMLQSGKRCSTPVQRTGHRSLQ